MLSKTLAGQTVECRPLAYLVIAVGQRPRYAFQDASEARLALAQRHRHQVLAIEVEHIEEEIDEGRRIARIGRDPAP